MRAGLAPRFALWLLAGLPLGCAEPPPPECQAYVGCFYGDGASPYEGHPDYQRLEDARSTVLAAYGEGGECWRNGGGDVLWQRCREGCLAVLDASCQAFEDGGEDAFCVDAPGGEAVFAGGGVSVSCKDVESALAALPKGRDP